MHMVAVILREFTFWLRKFYLNFRLGMDGIVNVIIKFRKHICPKTSYVTAGSAASKLFVLDLFKLDDKGYLIPDGIVAKKEFATYQTFQTFEEIVANIDQHLVLVISNDPLESSMEEKLLELLKMKKTKLIFNIILQPPNKTNSTVTHNSVFKWNEFEEVYHASKVFSTVPAATQFKVWYFHKLYQIPVEKRPKLESYTTAPLGYNKQPAVSSRVHFRFLWNMFPENLLPLLPFKDSPANLKENKQRVLQRLADRAVYNPHQNGVEMKLSSAQWDDLITTALKNNGDDWDIYSLIRRKTFGTSLESDTDPLTILIPDYYASSLSLTKLNNDVIVDTQNSEERSDFLVNRIIECLPEPIQKNPSQHITSLLDYGCAEGGITAEVGKKLQLPPEKTYGADVRSITSHTFQFLPLANENRSKPLGIGHILPSLQNNSISLITTSMVFHHVMHIDHVLLELRRILNWENGLLLIREHDCLSSSSGAFLDIVHGLYSLAWQNPVEWPDFILEYEAFYRSREQWTSLLSGYGFELKAQQSNHYDDAVRSTWNSKKSRFSNVARAYYALYIPKRNFNLTFYLDPINLSKIPSSNNIKALPAGTSGESTEKTILRSFSRDENGVLILSSPRATKRSRSVDGEGNEGRTSTDPADQQILKRAKKDGDRKDTALSFDDYDVHESKQYPGYFYKFYKFQDRSVWIE